MKSSFSRSFFTAATILLLALSILAWLVWELFIFLHPERFWEGANTALTCASCTDKLCTQYCPKRNKK